MSLATTTNIQTECNLSEVAVALLTPHLATATVLLKRLLTVDAAGDRYTDLETPNTPYTSADQAILKKAEALLAGSIALPYLSINTAGSGLVTAVGMDADRQEIMSKGQVDRYAAHLKNDAMELLAPYIPNVNDNEDGERTATADTWRTGGMTFIACGGS